MLEIQNSPHRHSLIAKKSDFLEKSDFSNFRISQISALPRNERQEIRFFGKILKFRYHPFITGKKSDFLEKSDFSKGIRLLYRTNSLNTITICEGLANQCEATYSLSTLPMWFFHSLPVARKCSNTSASSSC
jgi:hypothetical protein